MGWELNAEKPRPVDLKQVGASLDLLGYTFRYDRDRHGRPYRYLNVVPSKKSLKKERATLRDMTSSRYCFKPIPVLIEDLNRNLAGWLLTFSSAIPVKLSAVSIPTCENVCGFIFIAAVNVLIVRPKASVSTRISRRLACTTWFCRSVHVDCSHESRM